MRKLKVVFYTFYFFAFLNSCNNNKAKGLKGQILNYCSGKKDCLIEIKSVTKFEWTEMFVFRNNATNEDIQKAIDTNYPYYKEFTDRIIFLKGKEIVYHEDNKTNIERIDKGDLIFNFSDTLKYANYRPNEAVFKLNNVEGSSGIYYEMIKQK